MGGSSLPVAISGGFLAGYLLKKRLRGGRGAADFEMDPRLLQGMALVCDLPLCRVLLVDDSNYPCWLVLVPRINHVREITDLTEPQQQQLIKEVAAASDIVQSLYRPFKMNLAAIGNIVEQLHLHVTGRLQTDPAWPGACYGAPPPRPLAKPELRGALSLLRNAFGTAKL